MPLTQMFRIDLRRSVVLLTVAATLVTLVIGFYASSQVQRQMLIDNTLEANRVYGAMLADITEQSLPAPGSSSASPRRSSRRVSTMTPTCSKSCGTCACKPTDTTR